MKRTFIYYLEKNNIPFYIGKANNLNIRLKQHKLFFGNEIIMNELDNVPMTEWLFWEKHYISLFKSWGFQLNNQNDGGGGPSYHTKETKDKIGNIIRGNLKRNKKISNSNKGVSRGKGRKITWDIDYIKRGKSISKSKKGIGLTKQHILALTGITKNHGAKISIANSKPVFQYNLEEKFIKEHDSLTKAAIYIGKPKGIGDITSVCRGNKNSAYGFKWKYKINQ